MNCIIVEDVVTTGTSVLETSVELRKLGNLVTHAIVLLDRRQVGKENLAKHGIELSAVFHVEEIMASLEKQIRGNAAMEILAENSEDSEIRIADCAGHCIAQF
ncbi:hypothetical protein DAPPUDRAFT_330061 [Daphnia pulex]|uniref:Phosphoribosyltransferase domain-containing protein n=1 Tax=Daphnia pulex TaxID=6669 RepID=E9HIG4_DAPPU|nr:hypothetical protein DAPPUDRAFT_331843 [Daphnia pulex]EFX68501.1 hypothetical protein DAPPUDRAFT_330061 [Daphnia pulex]|eukprot:EFX66689.1 hypothetical protein DAPPUDRAFT_331843 [Daphnia pulex]